MCRNRNEWYRSAVVTLLRRCSRHTRCAVTRRRHTACAYYKRVCADSSLTRMLEPDAAVDAEDRPGDVIGSV